MTGAGSRVTNTPAWGTYTQSLASKSSIATPNACRMPAHALHLEPQHGPIGLVTLRNVVADLQRERLRPVPRAMVGGLLRRIEKIAVVDLDFRLGARLVELRRCRGPRHRRDVVRCLDADVDRVAARPGERGNALQHDGLLGVGEHPADFLRAARHLLEAERPDQAVVDLLRRDLRPLPFALPCRFRRPNTAIGPTRPAARRPRRETGERLAAAAGSRPIAGRCSLGRLSPARDRFRPADGRISL